MLNGIWGHLGLIMLVGAIISPEDFYGRAATAPWFRRPAQQDQAEPPPQPDPLLQPASSNNDTCLVNLPSALSFIEPLVNIRPKEVVLFSGGDSLRRRQTGFGRVSSAALQDFASHHGYKLVFLDQINYEKSLQYGGLTFKPQWHRVFAMAELRAMFAEAKYFVWFDDDILVPYKETDMLNHYINMMEAEEDWQMLYGLEGADYVLNSGMFIMKNTDFSFRVYQETLDVALEEDGRLAYNQHMEQEAIAIIRSRHSLHDKIRVISHRDGPYNFNTFARDCSWDPPGLKSEYGDAFVHFLGDQQKERNMNAVMRLMLHWRKQKPIRCSYPVDINF